MSVSVLESQEFETVCVATPETTNYATSKQVKGNLKGISRVADSVVEAIQQTNGEVDSAKVKQFVAKVSQINDQFSVEDLGTPFKAAITAINFLLDLRKNLGANYGDLIKDPFTLKLKELSELPNIEKKDEVATNLYNYMENILTPALNNVTSSEELAILEPFVDQCMALYEQVKGVDKKHILRSSHNVMIEAYNAQHLKNGDLFTFVSNYSDGSLSRLDVEAKRSKVISSLDSFVDDFLKACKTSILSTDDKILIYDQLSEIEKAFAAVGHAEAFKPIMGKLNTAFDIPEAMRSSYPIHLASTPNGSIKAYAQNLYSFQTQVLIPYLNSATTTAQLESAAELIALCATRSDTVASVDTQDTLKNQKAEIKALVEVKEVLLSPLFVKILTANPGNIGDVTQGEHREKVISLLTPLFDKVKQAQGHPLFTEELKIQFFEGIMVIHQEFTGAGHGSTTEPLIEELRTTFNIPKPVVPVAIAIKEPEVKPVSTRFSKARAMFSSMEKESAPVPIRSTRAPKVVTLEERKDQALITIQGLLRTLDPQSVNFKSDLERILEEIKYVKNKYPEKTTTDFDQLEAAIELLLKPEVTLSVNSEEQMIINQLGSKHGISSVATQGYKLATERHSVREAQIGVIRVLNEAADSLENLNTLAKRATTKIRTNTMRRRFERFIASNPLTPPLTGHIASHFPYLVLILERYSKTLAINSVKELWQDISNMYDSTSGGNFSRILETYSYLDPKTLIPEILEEAQKAFMNGIDFRSIDAQEDIDFKEYMTSLTKYVGSLPNEMFEDLYKTYFAARHQWILDNLVYIKVPYNQGDEKDTNLGKGVCMSNSLNRLGTLTQNPDAPIEELTMGSTQKTRLNQAKVGHYFRAAEAGEVTYTYAHEQEIGQSVLYGITRSNKTAIENRTANIHQNLVNQMMIHAKGGNSSFLVSLYSTKPRAGHAINVQIDPSKRIYRIMDDNIGLIEYPSEAAFKRELGKYFAFNYSTYDSFYFSDFVSS
ncbi:MAG: hypothetical protein KFB95_08410 [Simkaniaceae bacterium]|nr:MAG: hypothetical protein KFB95_08410 [Simkaniaceae bacterium]